MSTTKNEYRVVEFVSSDGAVLYYPQKWTPGLLWGGDWLGIGGSFRAGVPCARFTTVKAAREFISNHRNNGRTVWP